VSEPTGALTNLGELSKSATVLIEKISDAVGAAFNGDAQTQAEIVVGIAITVYVGLHLIFHFIRKSKVRKRKSILANIAAELGFELTPAEQGPSYEEFRRDFDEARGDQQQPCAIRYLYRGIRGQRTLTLFEFSRSSASSRSSSGNLTEGIAVGLETQGLGLPTFRMIPRSRLLNMLPGVDSLIASATAAGKILELPNGIKVMVSGPEGRGNIKELFGPSVLSFLEEHPEWSVAGKGDHVWISASYPASVKGFEAVVTEAIHLFV
jgi:hypothetical protein